MNECELSIKSWLFLLCDFQLHFRSWNRIGGLSHGRTARRKLPCQGIVSGNSYLPTKGSRGTPIQYLSLKFWQVWMDSPQVQGSPSCSPWACIKLCVHHFPFEANSHGFDTNCWSLFSQSSLPPVQWLINDRIDQRPWNPVFFPTWIWSLFPPRLVRWKKLFAPLYIYYVLGWSTA